MQMTGLWPNHGPPTRAGVGKPFLSMARLERVWAL